MKNSKRVSSKPITGIPAPASARSGIVVTEGWLGVQGKYGYEAHGQFESVAVAWVMLRQHWPEYRRVASDMPGVVEAITIDVNCVTRTDHKAVETL